MRRVAVEMSAPTVNPVIAKNFECMKEMEGQGSTIQCVVLFFLLLLLLLLKSISKYIANRAYESVNLNEYNTNFIHIIFKVKR